MNINEHKPCPFCGNKTKIDVNYGIIYILCNYCRACISIRIRNQNRKNIIKEYNKREQKEVIENAKNKAY